MAARDERVRTETGRAASDVGKALSLGEAPCGLFPCDRHSRIRRVRARPRQGRPARPDAPAGRHATYARHHPATRGSAAEPRAPGAGARLPSRPTARADAERRRERVPRRPGARCHHRRPRGAVASGLDPNELRCHRETANVRRAEREGHRPGPTLVQDGGRRASALVTAGPRGHRRAGRAHRRPDVVPRREGAEWVRAARPDPVLRGERAAHVVDESRWRRV